MKIPNTEQLDALNEYAIKYGKGWKELLLTDWCLGRDVASIPNGHLLRQVRNQFGPSWLAWYLRPEEDITGVQWSIWNEQH